MRIAWPARLLLGACVVLSQIACGGGTATNGTADASVDAVGAGDSGGPAFDSMSTDALADGGGEAAGDAQADAVRGDAQDAQVEATTDAAPGDGGPASLCTSTGGSVVMTLCCTSTSDFPDLCGIGACGCSPANSHDVQTCECQMGKCFSPGLGCH